MSGPKLNNSICLAERRQKTGETQQSSGIRWWDIGRSGFVPPLFLGEP
jgi:hypothetical protein